MLKLTINEQKQILGGKDKFICEVYDSNGNLYCSRISTDRDSLERYGMQMASKIGGRYRTGYYVD